jgi:hypothetical protein
VVAVSLGVWSRNDVVRVDFENRRVVRPGIADGLVGRAPSQGLQVLGEAVGSDEGQDIGLEVFEIVMVEDLDRGVRDDAVQPLGSALGPRMVGL